MVLITRVTITLNSDSEALHIALSLVFVTAWPGSYFNVQITWKETEVKTISYLPLYGQVTSERQN